jgi:anti-sigma factor ChrR (cupin superfamily)
MDRHEDDPIAAFERALGLDPVTGEDEAGRAERNRLERRLAPLASLLEPVAPRPDLFARIAAQAGIDQPLPGFHVARHDAGGWKPRSEGVETRTLWRSKDPRRHVFLLRMQPGALLDRHDHGGDEECMVLEGDMQVGDVAFGPGDFQVAFAGTRHPLVTTRTGCLCLISLAA